MSERVGKIGLNAGTPWSLFAENTAFEDSQGIVDPRAQNVETARLHKEDMKLFGYSPSRDSLVLAVCKECQKILQTSALSSHYERKHPKMLSSLKRSPTRRCSVSKEIRSPPHSFGKSKLLKSPGNNSFIRIEEVDPTDINVKIEEVPLTIPKFNHEASKAKLPKIFNAKTGKASTEKSTVNAKVIQKKQVINKDKEYDPEKHCGVWIEDQTRNCTRSLTCKTHSLSSRRDVSGRSKPFDALLADHKSRVQNNKESGSSSGTNTPTATPSPTRTNPPSFPSKSERLSATTDVRSPSTKDHSRSEAKRHSSTDDHSSTFTQSQPCYIDYIPDDPLGLSAIPTLSHHPKPMAVNSFSSHKTGSGCFIFGKNLEGFRHATQSMIDKIIRSNSRLSNPPTSNISFKVTAGADGICSTQVVNEGSIHLQDNTSSFTLNSSSTETSRFGSVPRVKTKGSKASANSLKRQVSDTYLTENYSASRKRRHSADLSRIDVMSRESSLLDNTMLNDNNNTKDSAIDLAKCVNEIGQALSGFDVESLDTNFLSGTLLCADTNQTGVSNLTISGGNITTNLNPNLSLNSSLSLCQTMGLTPGIHQNLNLNIGGSQNPIVVDQGQLVNHMVAPNVAVTQGMMVSLPNVTQVQSLAGYQGNLKEILPAPNLKQQGSSAGIYIAAQGQQSASQLPNGNVSSPETFSIAYSPGQGISTANINASIRAGSTSLGAGNKRLNVSGNSRVSQLVVRQPSQQLHAYQRDLSNQRVSPFQKPAPYDGRKSSSPGQKLQNPARSPSQLQTYTTSTSQLLTNNPQFNVSSQPIAQLKQMQIQQFQQQQLLSPLNTAVQGETLSYQQQILPKLLVSPGRNLPAQIVNSQTLQVNTQHLQQQRSVLEPSTP